MLVHDYHAALDDGMLEDRPGRAILGADFFEFVDQERKGETVRSDEALVAFGITVVYAEDQSVDGFEF